MAEENFNADELLVATQGGDEIAQRAASTPGKGDDGEGNGGEGNPTPPSTNNGGQGEGAPGSGSEGRDSNQKGAPNPPSEEEINEVKNDLSKFITNFNDPNNKEAQDIKSELLELVKGGTDIDEDGNVLDKDGNVLSTFDELSKKVATQPKANYDDKGNEIDEEGNIVRTKFEIDLENSEVNQIAKELNLEITDANGNPKLYKGGNEGLKDFISDAVEVGLAQAQQEFFNSNPVLREVSKHLLLGGALEDFNKPTDYNKIDIKNLTTEQKKNYIKQSYIAEGTAPERAEKVIGLLNDKALDDDVKEAFNVLKAKEEAVTQARDQELQRQEEARARENHQFWTETKQVISKGNLDGFEIPANDRDKFFEYLAIPVKDGMSQDMIDRQERSRALELKEAFYRFKGYDVSKIVNQETRNRRVTSLRERVRKSQELQQTRKPGSKGGSNEVDWDNIQGS